ncbi:MAG: hypothetical protein H0W72_17310 [Planctomycetes bacterium]|nr:hypothetical protein [Planctomycetota bacterium]
MSSSLAGHTPGLIGLVVALAAANPACGEEAHAHPHSAPAIPSPRLIDISLDVLTAAGGSTVEDADLGGLQAGHHDPARRGFTLQQVEMALVGAVDPYFTASAYAVMGEEGVELEEAYALTTSLPHDLQAKAGYFLTEFGRTNPTHPHALPWLTRAVVATRMFGADGTRAAGVRLAWLAPLPWYSRVLVSGQNPADDTAASFRGLVDEDDSTITVGGRPRLDDEQTHALGDLLWLLRWENGGDFGDVSAKLGVSFLSGANATGGDAQTRIYGIDAVAKWTPPGGRQGHPFVQVEAEVIRRDFQADAFDDGITPPLAAEELHDQGGYAQALYGFIPGWAAGLRGEWAGGDGGNSGDARRNDPARADRIRLSPLLIWNPSHFSKLRLEYDYDRFDHPTADGDDQAHAVWLGLEVLFGAHPAHSF